MDNIFRLLLFFIMIPFGASCAFAAAPVKAQVVVVKEQALPVFASFPGRISSTDEVQVASRMMGYVRRLLVHEGQQVKKGELLLSIDDSDIRGGIAQARAAVAKADSVLADAKANYQRFLALYQQKAIPQQQFQQVEMGYRVAQGNCDAARAALKQAKAQLNYVDVRAPFAGTVVSKFIDVGQLAAPGRPLLTLQSGGYLQVMVQVSQRAFDQLHIGQQVAVVIDSSDFNTRRELATVARLVAAADPMTHSHSVKLNLAENSVGRSGDFARVQIQIGTQPGVLLPASAVQRRAGIDGVFVVNGDGQVAFRMVRLGEQRDKQVVVLSGVVAGERVVVSVDGELNNGVRVQIVQGAAL